MSVDNNSDIRDFQTGIAQKKIISKGVYEKNYRNMGFSINNVLKIDKQGDWNKKYYLVRRYINYPKFRTLIISDIKFLDNKFRTKNS